MGIQALVSWSIAEEAKDMSRVFEKVDRFWPTVRYEPVYYSFLV
ncbi:MAG: hypothetical protein UZ21_OP11001001141 [Microgenomates bacterium OLB22]|nr:MAG: hypothetical protein UZ21_OP11001001141 [Microgenomates bacterium OLB22]